MANWWDAAPLAQPAQPAAGVSWWDAAPLAQSATGAATTIPATGGAPPRVIMDMSKTAAPDRGAVDAFKRGGVQGLSLNFGDELAALTEAGGGDPTLKEGRYGIDHLIMGLAKYWFGDEQAQSKYDEVVKRERDLNKTAEEQHPVASTTGQIGGSLLLPVGPVAGAATLPGRMAVGAGVGALMGGASGVGEGVGAADSISRGAIGTVGGTVLGAAAPVAIKGIELAGQGIGKGLQSVAENYRSIVSPNAEAARRVLDAQARDAVSAAPGLTPAAFDAAKASGSPVINADMGGGVTQSLARSAANTSPEGRTLLEKVSGERYKTQSPRLAKWLNETFDFPEPGPTLDRLQEAARRENRPAYLKAYAEGAVIPFDEALQTLSRAPVVNDAIRKAMLTAKNEAAKLDLPPPKNPFQFDADGFVSLKTNPDGSTMTPNLQFWDIVKRNLDKTGTAESRDWARVLREHLDDIVPSYNPARSGAAKFFGAEDAMDAGGKFATMSGRDALAIADARKGFANLKPAEKKLFETGFVSNLIAKIEDLKDGQDVVKQIFNSEFAKKQIVMALGPQRAAELEAKLLAERAMDGVRNALGNSTTARQWIERGLAGGAAGLGGVGTYDTDPKKLGIAALTGALAFGSRRIDQRMARKVAEMLASDDPKILDAGIKLISKSTILRDALLKLDLPVARAAGEQAPYLPAIQAGSAGRADEQQQPVPGPVH